ncbi:hypothetical protein [Chromobacterium sp. ASV23]|uniref:COG4315 family predicted lipoprotein n=1 Tax=Chromobacterium sp. ASV23 TaxID=2795110 RepID=UPI0018ED7A56|nr:hypothetical protein [Chromobacterium sp. ASV23]
MRHSRIAAAMFLSVLAAQAAAGSPPPSIQNGLLADSAGKTLYVFDKDQAGAGRSVCNDACADLWPPLLADKEDQPKGELGLAIRDDGTPQWTWRGKPLYRYAHDSAPGEQKGENFKQLWHTIKP